MSSTQKSFLALLGLLPLALVSAAACGGSAFENRNGGAGSTGLAGTSSAAGSSNATGGSENVAGAFHGTGGSGQAGSATGGALGRGGSASGVGGTGSGIAGNGGVDMHSCTSNAQCVIVPVSCCSCGLLGPATDFTAINSAYEAELDGRCQAVDCAPCGPMRAPSPNDPYYSLAATCETPAEAPPDTPGHCAVVNLKETEITACKTTSDCSLRAGTACCSGCNGMPVALNGKQGAALSALVCPSEPVGCPACAPIFESYLAVCTDGRCAVDQTFN